MRFGRCWYGIVGGVTLKFLMQRKKAQAGFREIP
jgi:hypothetical protein